MKKFCSKAVAKHQKLNNKLQKSIKKPRKEGGRTSDNRPYRKTPQIHPISGNNPYFFEEKWSNTSQKIPK